MPKLKEIFDFSHSDEFGDYRRWWELESRFFADPVLVWTEEDQAAFSGWPSVQVLWEKVLPEARAIKETFDRSLKEELEAYKKAVKDLENQSKLFEFYKVVLEKLTSLYLDSLSTMLSEVYRSVYCTTTKSVQLVMEDFRNKKVIRLRIINHIDGKDYVEDFQNEGGAAQVILGIIVAVYFILTTGGERIIFIDESLSALHQETLERFLQILQQFKESLGFVFVIISHDYVRIRNHLDKVYRVQNGEYIEVPVDVFVKQSLEEVV
jgi:DNA repair exonuclease SbcCD ATPase subunit